MKLKIDSKIFEQFPELNIGIVVAKGINNATISHEVMDLIQGESKKVRSNFNKETLSANPKVRAWREAYSSFGAKPKKYKCSVENLYRMILDGTELKHVNKIVDIYNYISIKHMVPMGGDDIDKIDRSLRTFDYCDLGLTEHYLLGIALDTFINYLC
jgi:DNA/RNA-binding domain of Phe-tRNA-synthetase-like protein